MHDLRIKNVVFDFGGVLVSWRPRQIVERLFDDEQVRDTIMQSVFGHSDWLDLDRGTLEESEAVERFAARTGVSRPDIALLLQNIRESLTPLPDSVELLRELARRKVALYGLSNMPASTFRFLRQRDDFWSLFADIVISGEIRMMKPEARIFEHLAARNGLSFAESVFIDDTEANVIAARTLGLRSILFKGCEPCRVELYDLLGLPK